MRVSMVTVVTLKHYFGRSFFFFILCDQTPPFLQAAADDYNTEQEPHYHYLKRFAQITDSSSKWVVNCWAVDDSTELQS